MVNDNDANSAQTYRLEDQIGFMLRLANQKHLEIFANRIPDMTPTQLAVLTKLRDEGRISQNHLGRLVAMDAATTKGVVDRLRNTGLIESAPSLTDKRRLEIKLSDAGRKYIDKRVNDALEVSAMTLASLSPREAERLLALLKKL